MNELILNDKGSICYNPLISGSEIEGTNLVVWIEEKEEKELKELKGLIIREKGKKNKNIKFK